MSTQSYYKYCFVPNCISTNTKMADKIFFNVPCDPSIRKKWFESAGRTDESKWKFSCCEDHFDIEKDVENLIRHRLTGQAARLKKGVTPHKFDCQPDRQRINELKKAGYNKLNIKRPKFEMLSRHAKTNAAKDMINLAELTKIGEGVMDFEEIMIKEEKEEQNEDTPNLNVSITSSDETERIAFVDCSKSSKHSFEEIIIKDEPLEDKDNRDTINVIESSNDSQNVCIVDDIIIMTEEEIVTPEYESGPIILHTLLQNHNPIMEPSKISQTSSKSENLPPLLYFSTETSTFDESLRPSFENVKKSIARPKHRNVGVQVRRNRTRPHFRSKAILCKPEIVEVACQTPIKWKEN